MTDMLIKTPGVAEVNVLHLLVKIVDHLREAPGYSDGDRSYGLNCAEGLIRVIKTQTGNQQVVGRGMPGGV